MRWPFLVGLLLGGGVLGLAACEDDVPENFNGVVEDECPHHGLGGAHRAHLGDKTAENGAVSAEVDEIELHALDRDAGLVLDDEIQATVVVGALDAVELNAHLFFRRKRADRREHLQDDERTPMAIVPQPDAARESAPSPLRPMSAAERVMADYAGTSLTIGPHPMALRRPELALRGVLRARDLPSARHGRRVRVAGAVITRQRPGTAKGFVFLTLEDETGIANIIVQPDLFTTERLTIVGEPYLLVEGTLQIQEGVTSVKADRVLPLIGSDSAPEPQSHDFR